MPLTTLTIGWTQSDLPEYSSFGDGYRPGARQHTETIEVEVPEDQTPEQIAEAVFMATNAPFVAEGTLPARIAEAIEAAGYHGQGAHYSLSTGDTVTVGATTLACESLGWAEVVS